MTHLRDCKRIQPGAWPHRGPSGHLCCSELVLAIYFRPVLSAGHFRSVHGMCSLAALICPGFYLEVGGCEISLSANAGATIFHSETLSEIL